MRRHPANGENLHSLAGIITRVRTGAGEKGFVWTYPIKTGHYQPSQFGHLAQVWELDLIIKTEQQQLAQIRSLQDHLHDMNVQLKNHRGKFTNGN